VVLICGFCGFLLVVTGGWWLRISAYFGDLRSFVVLGSV